MAIRPNRALAALVGGLAVVAASPPAWAKVMTLTYFGTMASGEDPLGLFGGPTDLTGRAFTATFVFDTDFEGRTQTAFADRIAGGSERGLPAFLDAMLEIDGFSHSFPGGALELVGQSNTGVSALSSNRGDVIGPPPTHFAPDGDILNAFMTNAPNRFDLERSREWLATGSAGYFQLSPTNAGRSYGYFEMSRAVLAEDGWAPGAVPEPATWALLIAGFGLAGASLRRQRFREGCGRRLGSL